MFRWSFADAGRYREQAILSTVRLYAAWQTLAAAETATLEVPIDSRLLLRADEWMIMEPVVQAECQLRQATQMEAARSRGAEMFGLSVVKRIQCCNRLRQKWAKMLFALSHFRLSWNKAHVSAGGGCNR